MAKYENKTQKTNKSVTEFINSIDDPVKKEDSKKLVTLMKKITGKKPVMWGPSIIGFGDYEYKRRDGSAHKFFMVGFSPRKQNISLYFMTGFKKYDGHLKKLGKYKTSVGCLYVKRLEDIDLKILEKMISEAVKEMKKNYKTS